ncbi:hypothetical protein H4582DRAFT_463984 [Lactarius indigo]|nr:hypothetical protein H4582DRAFT_309085 [Lactarius indigo]KAI9436246.1 hypothetical protein H4582DRAFT_463984 [Lactarius indigo]
MNFRSSSLLLPLSYTIGVHVTTSKMSLSLAHYCFREDLGHVRPCLVCAELEYHIIPCVCWGSGRTGGRPYLGSHSHIIG